MHQKINSLSDLVKAAGYNHSSLFQAMKESDQNYFRREEQNNKQSIHTINAKTAKAICTGKLGFMPPDVAIVLWDALKNTDSWKKKGQEFDSLFLNLFEAHNRRDTPLLEGKILLIDGDTGPTVPIPNALQRRKWPEELGQMMSLARNPLYVTENPVVISGPNTSAHYEGPLCSCDLRHEL